MKVGFTFIIVAISAALTVTSMVSALCIDSQVVFAPNGKYMKTFCTLNVLVTRDAAAQACASQGMKLANGDSAQSQAALISRANNGQYKGIATGTIWLQEKTGNQCSILLNSNGSTYEKSVKDCNSRHVAYCEYDVCYDHQKAYDSNGKYLKTYCTLNNLVTRDAAALTCAYRNMTLANANTAQTQAALVSRANNGQYKGIATGTIWLQGKSDNQCSMLFNSNGTTYEKSEKDCNSRHVAYCEYNVSALCIDHQDVYNSVGNYLKTYCTLNTLATRDAAAQACGSQGIVLASANTAENEAALISRANNGQYKGIATGTIWLQEKAGNQCSILFNSNGTTYQKSEKDCNSGHVAYCEYSVLA